VVESQKLAMSNERTMDIMAVACGVAGRLRAAAASILPKQNVEMAGRRMLQTKIDEPDGA